MNDQNNNPHDPHESPHDSHDDSHASGAGRRPGDERDALAEHGIEIEPEEEATRPQRQASLQLRRVEEQDQIASLDPAQQSLQQALRISFAVLKVVMIVLLVLFATSGFRTIQEGNMGLRLVFGAIRDQEPAGSGAVWTYPQPIGELVVVPITQQEMKIRSFLPGRMPNEEGKAWSAIRRSPSSGLVPGKDGYTITADGNIVHSGWSLLYRYDDVIKVESNISRAAIEELIRVAVERGIVHAMSETTLDNPDEETYDALTGSREVISNIARKKAQEALDEVDSGIVITSLTLEETFGPLSIYGSFAEVTRAQSEAMQLEEDARAQAVQKLNQVAGAANQRLVELIDEYDLQTELGHKDQADHLLKRIDAVMLGQPLEEDQGVVISGDVTQILESATQKRVDIKQQAEAEYNSFNAMREQFAKAPEVTIAKYWQRAFLSVLGRETTQTIFIPDDTSEVEILVGPDPDVNRRVEEKRRKQEAERMKREYEQDRGLPPEKPSSGGNADLK